MKKQKIFTFILTLFTSVSVSASYCKYLKAKTATQVFNKLAEYKKDKPIAILDKYCRECGDTYVKPMVLEEIIYRPYQVKGYASIAVNGQEIDLAYLYLEGNNLAHAYGCKSPAGKSSLTSKLEVK